MTYSMAKGNKSGSKGPVTVEYKGNKFVLDAPEHGIFILVSSDGKKTNKYQLFAKSKDTGKNASRLIAGDAAKELSKEHGLDIKEKTTNPRAKTTGKKITMAKMLKLAKLALKKGASKTEIVEVLGMDPFGEDSDGEEEEKPKKASKKTTKSTKNTKKKAPVEESEEADDDAEESEEEKPAPKKGKARKVVESEDEESEEEKPAPKKSPKKAKKAKKIVDEDDEDEE